MLLRAVVGVGVAVVEAVKARIEIAVRAVAAPISQPSVQY